VSSLAADKAQKGIQTELECNHVKQVGPMQSKRKEVVLEE
jgi:hypothetical protein